MSSYRPTQSQKTPGATKRKASVPAEPELTPVEVEKKMVEVLQHLEQLKELLSAKLDHVYEIVNKSTDTAKQALVSDIHAGAQVKSLPALSKISGSLNELLSQVISVNDEQRQLFLDMAADKLFGAISVGKKIPFDKNKASQFVDKVVSLISNLQNLSLKLDRNLRMTQGKGLTLERGKDLPDAHREALINECQRLQDVISQQIKVNVTLKNKLTSAAETNKLTSAADRPDAPSPRPRQSRP